MMINLWGNVPWWGWILIILLVIFLWVFVVARIVRRIKKFPIPQFLTNIIDNPIRRALIQKPKEIAERMKLEPGMNVMEIGPGKGSYTLAVAKAIGDEGTVHAIDIQEEVLQRLQKRLDRENITNIMPKKEDIHELSFQDCTFDRVYANACMPEIPNPVHAMEEIKRVLKPGGILSLCELLIDPDYPLRKTEKKWAENAGFVHVESFGNFFAYQLNFQKPLKE